ncbi:hypothetical protein [Alteromonas stellipolaris]|uniref:hypothetical protein n=1 Tax=Alteromonas stellipolaris TaxID=233316 RepID=UPI00249468DF|nr:hypothetical protein [Alteromonas stellipolaris]
MIVKPQGWVILKFSAPTDTFYKIFSSWRGGYLDGDSWRLSSGSRQPPSLSVCGKYWVWKQESGSYYHLPFYGEDGYTPYSAQILGNIIIQSGENDVFIERVKLSSLIR